MGNGVFVELQQEIIGQSFVVFGLETGTVYTFLVQARTAFAFSAYSSQVQILAAEVPSKPEAPTFQLTQQAVIFNWQAPNEMGSSILGYRLLVRHQDGVNFSEDLNNCDGSVENIK